MKKVLLLLMILGFAGLSQAQEKFGEWLYLSSDKPIQYRYFKVKEEDGRVYFKMQVKYDKTVSTYCQRCPGYTIFISSDRPNGGYKLFYKFYQSDNVVTLDHLFSSSKLNEDDRWKSYWDEDKVAPMITDKAAGTTEYLRFASWCVDSFKDDGVEEFNRCRRDFQGLTAVEIR